MRKKNKIVVAVIFAVLVFGLCLLYHRFCGFFSINNNSAKATASDLCEIISEDFETDSVIVTLTREETLKFKEYTEKDFEDIDCVNVEDLTQFTVDYVCMKINGKEADKPMRVDVDNFKRILRLELGEKTKENVLRSVEILKERKELLCVEPNFIYHITAIPDDYYFDQINATGYCSWNLRDGNGINAVDAWDMTTGSVSVLVGVLDTGIDANHPDLAANINTSGLHRDCTVSPILTVSNLDLNDPNEHGTHVAGIIGATGNNTIGVTGICWNTSLVSLRVFDAFGGGNTGSIARAIDYAKSVDIPILNYSGGTYIEDTNLLNTICNYTGLFVCSAGNDANNNDSTHHYPSHYAYNSQRVISVGALNNSGGRWSGSNYGATTVSIYAPGDGIISTIPDNSYSNKSGTSMAAPHVTGVAALMLSVNPNLTSSELKDLILNNADTIQITYPYSAIEHDVKKLNAHKAVVAALLNINSSGQITGQKCGTTFSGVLNIPDEINGIIVSGVAANAFSALINQNVTSITSVKLPNTVTSIGSNAFRGCTGMANIEIPSGVTYISDGAFYNCTSLESIDLPSGLTAISDNTFYNCTSLESVDYSSVLLSIGEYAFNNCYLLSDFALSSGLTAIGDHAFNGCYSLSNITIPYSVSSVGIGAFTVSGLSITWEYGNNTLTAANFATHLTDVVFSSTVTSIRPYSFNGATNLEEITIPSNIVSIGSSAFYNCTSLENITIPSSVNEVGTYAFHNCTNLEITWHYGNSGSLTATNFADKLSYVTFENNITSIRANSFAGATNLSSIAIPSGITSIGANAFYGCTGLTSINIPQYVSSIGQEAFAGCSGLTSITVDTNNTTYKSEGNCLIRKSDNALILGCSTSIIPNTVVSIEANAFNGCTALMSVNIPSSVTSIGANAFSGCTALERVLIDHSDHGITLGSGAFYSTSSNLTILVPYNLSQLYTFSGDWSGYLTKICYYEIYNNQMYQTYIVNFWQPDDYFTVTYYTDHIIIEMININSSDPGTIIDCCASFYVNTTDEFCVIWSGAYLPEYCYTVNGWIIVPYCNEIGGYIEEFVIFPDDYGTMPYISIYDMLFTIAYRGSVIE